MSVDLRYFDDFLPNSSILLFALFLTLKQLYYKTSLEKYITFVLKYIAHKMKLKYKTHIYFLNCRTNCSAIHTTGVE